MADTVRAMLEPGEYVIRKDAAEELGPSLLNMLNNADRVGYQEGGVAEDIIPAGKNIFGQPTEAMTMEELFEMIMPGVGSTFKAVKMMSKAEKLLRKGKQGMMVPGHSRGFLEFPKYTFESDKTVLNSITSLKNAIKEREKMATFYKSIGKPLDKSRSMKLWSDKKRLEALEDFYTMPSKQEGGYIDEFQEGGYANMPEDYSLLDLTMPIMDDRLGPVGVKKYSHGGDVYGGFSVSPEQIFQEQGLKWDPDYGETIEEYDPTRERQLSQSLMGKFAAPGSQVGTFAGTGGYGVGKEAREKGMRGYFSGVAGLRGEHMGDVESQLAKDIADETFDFEELRHWEGAPMGNITGQYSSAAPPGWPSPQSYEAWRAAGGDPNNATSYGWSGEGTPGYKPEVALGGETGGNGGDGNVIPMGDPGGGGSGGQSGYGNIKPWGFPGEKEPRGYYGTIY